MGWLPGTSTMKQSPKALAVASGGVVGSFALASFLISHVRGVARVL